MNFKLTKQLKNNPKYFIHSGGFVFKVINAKTDFVLKNELDEKSRTVYVQIDGKKLNLFYLMMEYFMPTIKQNHQFKYAITDGNKIPLSGIKISEFTNEISDLHSETIIKFNCKQRAENANLRASGILTAMHVAECLISNDFKCYYCNESLNINWHLDHYNPIAKGGVNVFSNIVPSCSICNIMKGAIGPIKFYNQCKKIFENLSLKEDRNQNL